MMPGLEDQERIFVNKFVYRWEPIARGDIVVFRYPRDTSKSYIKRVIGVAGDRVRIETDKSTSTVKLSKRLRSSDYADARSYAEITVPGCVFRPRRPSHHVQRRRDFGPVNDASSTQSVFGYWPMEKWAGCGRLPVAHPGKSCAAGKSLFPEI